MSYADGWAAIQLEMPPRVPRTEYSTGGHFPLLSAVTGIEVDRHSPPERKGEANRLFMQKWNFDFMWSVAIGGGEFGDKRTRMGHAEYADGGTDFDTHIVCPFEEPEDVLAWDPRAEYPRRDHAELVQHFEDAYRRNVEGYGDAVNMTGIYTTLVSGLIDMFGWDMLLMAAGVDPRGFGEVTNRYSQWVQQYFDALAEADVPVVMIHDDMVWTSGPFIHPDWYREFIFPNLKRQLAPLVEAGKRIMFTSDGNFTEFIDDLVACGVNGFVMEPATDMGYIAEKYGKTHVFVGNADTRILLRNDRPAIRAEVERCLAIGKDCPGFFMAVGNHIPPNTPVEACLYYNEVYEQLSRR